MSSQLDFGQSPKKIMSSLLKSVCLGKKLSPPSQIGEKVSTLFFVGIWEPWCFGKFGSSRSSLWTPFIVKIHRFVELAVSFIPLLNAVSNVVMTTVECQKKTGFPRFDPGSFFKMPGSLIIPPARFLGSFF